VTPLPSSPVRVRVALAACLALLATFACWTALPPDWPHWPTRIGNEHYNLLVRGLLAGHTSLDLQPRPELLALDDPYDPIKNHQMDGVGRYCLHDAALFQGKYYLYFGVTPAVVLMAPYRLVTGSFLPTRVASLVFALGGMAWAGLLLNLLVTRLFPGLRAGTRLLLMLAAGCCSGVLYLLRGPMHWELAILSAYCFVMGALYFLARGGLGDRLRPVSLACGSLCLGLAVGCRPNMLLVALPVFAVALVWLAARLRQRLLTRRQVAGLAAVLLGPWSLCLLLLGAYNYARFGSFTEFGVRYNLVGATVRVVDMPVLDWRRLGVDLYCYLLTPPRLLARFPYVRLVRPVSGWTLPGYFGFGEVGGLLTGMPFLWVLALLPVCLYRAWKAGRYAYLAALGVCFGAGLLELLCVSCFGECMRYEVDFAALFVFAALLVLLDLEAWSRISHVLNRSVRALAAAGIAIACLFQLGISIEGQRFQAEDFAVRERLRQVFPRLPVPTRSLQVRLEVVFPAQTSAGQCEPLVVLGKPNACDFLAVRYLGGDNLALGFHHLEFGCETQLGNPVHIEPGRRYTLEAELLPADTRVVCRLDGEEVLNLETILFPIERNGYRIGENMLPCGLFTADRFSGTILGGSVRPRYCYAGGRAATLCFALVRPACFARLPADRTAEAAPCDPQSLPSPWPPCWQRPDSAPPSRTPGRSSSSRARSGPSSSSSATSATPPSRARPGAG
jgi:hypothetical protein